MCAHVDGREMSVCVCVKEREKERENKWRKAWGGKG